MSHTLAISDETYLTLETIAQHQGQSPEELVESWIRQHASPEEERDPNTNPQYESFDEFFLGLGMSEDEIREAKANAENTNADV